MGVEYKEDKPEDAQKHWYNLMEIEKELDKVVDAWIKAGMLHADVIRALEGCKLGVTIRFMDTRDED